MELLEGVMAFAVVMIILSTIATGITEAILRLLATRQRVLGKALKSLFAKEILPRFGPSLEARYGIDPSKIGALSRAEIADLLMRQMTLNPSGTPGEDKEMEALDGGTSWFGGRLWLCATRGVERLTTYSFIQRLAKTEVGVALVDSLTDTVSDRLIGARSEEAVAAAGGAGAAPEIDRLAEISGNIEAAEQKRRAAAQARRAAAEARLSDALAEAVETINSEAAEQAVRLVHDLASRAPVDIRAALEIVDAAKLAREYVKFTSAETLVETVLLEAEAIGREEAERNVADEKIRAQDRATLADAFEAAMKVADSPAVKQAVVSLAEATGHVLGDAIASVVEDAEAALKAKLNRTLNDVSRTFERYVAAANETFRAHAHVVTVIVAFSICIFGNVDAGRVFNHLMNNPDVRDALIAQAEDSSEANRAAIEALNVTLARLEKGEESGLSEEEIAKLGEVIAPLGKLIDRDQLPIGSAYYPYCGLSPLDFLGEAPAADSAACKGGTDRDGLSWLVNVLIAGALVSMGGPFWYRVFASLSQLASMLRHFGGGGGKEKIEPDDEKEQPASASAQKKEDIATTFLTAMSGKPGNVS